MLPWRTIIHSDLMEVKINLRPLRIWRIYTSINKKECDLCFFLKSQAELSGNLMKFYFKLSLKRFCRLFRVIMGFCSIYNSHVATYPNNDHAKQLCRQKYINLNI